MPADIEAQVARALAEDLGSGDVTARLIAAGTLASATVLTREAMVLCGIAWVEASFRQVDPRVTLNWNAREGDAVAANTVLCEIDGPARALLTGERCALNFLQTLSGTATLTRRYVDAVAGTTCNILDTRKTLPGLRLAQKYAVRCGGGRNYRMGLHDMVLIKENHIIAAGSVNAALTRARAVAPGVPVEIEVETLEEFRAALAAGPDIVMLDEFSHPDMRAAVELNRAAGGKVRIEASGGVDLSTVREVAATGVDFISIGALTKHLQAVDLSMRFRLLPG
ncbi:MAG: carboxylating nicotinate-nucleotide diphosphorylase [Pseudomonadota bacterium]